METGDDDGLEFLPNDGGVGSGGDDDFPIDEGDAISNPWDAIESGIFGDIGGSFNLGSCLDEEDMDSAYQSGETSSVASGGSFPKSGKGRISVGAAIVNEFEVSGQKIAYLLLHERITNCFIESATKKKQAESLSWVFTREPDEHNRTFVECCEALMVRPWVLQTRIQYQFYIKSMVFSEPLPDNMVMLPNLIHAESSYYGGDEGVVLATIAWMQPGIEHKELVTSKESIRAAQLLEEKGILSESKGCWYMTGRNPLMKDYIRTSISWSGLWPDER